MNPETQPTVLTAPESSATDPRGATVPIWLIVLTCLLLYWGAIYFDQSGGWFSPKVYTPYISVTQLEDYVPRGGEADPVAGGRLFNNYCAVCHGTDGAGRPGQAPPLAGSEFVNAKGVNRLVRIPVLGLNGPITVKGTEYNIGSGMTALAPNSNRQVFTDQMLADLLTYIRQAWGNNAGPVSVAEVKAIRDEIGTRSAQLTVKELLTYPEEK